MALRPEQLFPAGASAPPYTLIDVRSPLEVARGALPHAHAQPLMSDGERHLVGLRYRDAGQDAALELAYQLAGHELPARIEAWRAACSTAPTAVTCWRGGLRSRLAAEMIALPAVTTVEGGYKAIRAHLVASLPASLGRKQLMVLTGLTGSGKTALLRELSGANPAVQVIDLEGEARHHGSAFGALEQPQPSQATFENAVAAALLLEPAGTLVVEDESAFIGARSIPAPLLEAMHAAPVVVLEIPRPQRVERVFDEYVRGAAERCGVQAARGRLEEAVTHLRARLGGARTDAVTQALRAAESAWYDPDAHRGWITTLLEEHYDPLYGRALKKRDRRVLARGDAAAVRGYLVGAAA